MKIVSFNLRCHWKSEDGINAFMHRAGLIYEKINQEQPDVIAFQEVKKTSRDLLEKMLPEYQFFGTLREANYTGEGLYTAIRKDLYVFLGLEVFWLSPTPFVTGSRFENQSPCPRICVVTKIRNKETNEIFRVMNLHLDHVSDEARRLGLDCIFKFWEKYEALEHIPTVMLGDFNALPTDSVMQKYAERSGWIDTTKDISATFHNFGKTEKKIDYIFVTEEWKDRIENVETWTDCHEGIYLSDHYPVCLYIKNE